MVVLVDGYNVTRFLFPRESSSHEAELAFFLTQLARYRSVKKQELVDIIVVLDGGIFSHKTREILSGIAVVYAGHGRKADDVLVEYAKQLRNGSILISNDRELQRQVAAHDCISVSVADFWTLVTQVCKASQQEALVEQFGSVSFMKYSTEDDEHDDMESDIDSLIIKGSIGVRCVKSEEGQTKRQRDGVNTLSKKEKMIRAVRKKLG
jgi:predicted RNA-binding protein with PIN domain